MTRLDTDLETLAPRLSDLDEPERDRLFAKVQDEWHHLGRIATQFRG